MRGGLNVWKFSPNLGEFVGERPSFVFGEGQDTYQSSFQLVAVFFFFLECPGRALNHDVGLFQREHSGGKKVAYHFK